VTSFETECWRRAVREVRPIERWEAPKGENAKDTAALTWMGMGELCSEIATMAKYYISQGEQQQKEEWWQK
jgi:hypothetical protein